MARDREENAAAKARAHKEQEAKRQERVEKVARILAARRAAADEKAKAAAQAAEDAAYERVKMVNERTRIREAAKAGAKREVRAAAGGSIVRGKAAVPLPLSRCDTAVYWLRACSRPSMCTRVRACVQAALEFAHRLEKVWKHAETVVARCEREYSQLSLIADARESSYTQEELERRMLALETAKSRAAGARESLDCCLEERCSVYVASRHVRDEEEQAGAPE